jgi:hypothetical protein
MACAVRQRVSRVTALLAGSSSRFRAARLLRIRLAILTFVMSPLIIALFDLPRHHSLDRDKAVPISVDSINEAAWAKRVKSDDEPMSLSSFIWSVADLLRGDYKQSEYGKVILPFTVLRPMDCVLEGTKQAVLAENVARRRPEPIPRPFFSASPSRASTIRRPWT